MKKFYAAAALCSLLLLSGCSDWENPSPPSQSEPVTSGKPRESEYQLYLSDFPPMEEYVDFPLPVQTETDNKLLDTIWEEIKSPAVPSREGLCVLKTERHDALYYSVVLIVGEGQGFSLARYTLSEQGNINLIELDGSSNGSPLSPYPVINYSEEATVAWGVTESTRMSRSESGEWGGALMENDLTEIRFTLEDGSILIKQPTTPSAYIYIYPPETRIVQASLFNSEGAIGMDRNYISD